MKFIASTAAICLVIGASVFTTQKVVQAEARKTRKSMPGLLNNPLGDGDSLVTKVDKLNASLASIDRRLTRLEDITGREAKAETADIKKSTSEIQQEVERLSAQVNAFAKNQTQLSDIPRQLQIVNANMRNVVNAISSKDEATASTPQEVLTALDWMIEKIDNIDGYFPPLYDFLGAVYSGDESAVSGYPSVDIRINEILLMLEDLQKDASATRKLVTPYVIEPKKRPRPFEMDN